jgi:hypothetical protein
MGNGQPHQRGEELIDHRSIHSELKLAQFTSQLLRLPSFGLLGHNCTVSRFTFNKSGHSPSPTRGDDPVVSSAAKYEPRLSAERLMPLRSY